MGESFAAETLRELVMDHLDASPDSLRFAPVRTGKHNSSFWVDSDCGRYVLRIAPPDDAGFLFYERLMMRQEPDIHALVRAHTQIPLAEIAGYDFGRTRIPRDYVLMRALPGQPLSEVRNIARDEFHRTLYQVGQRLAQLHRLTAPDCLSLDAYGYLGAHHPMPPQPTWPQAFRVMWNMLLDDVVACGAYTAAEGQAMRDLLDRHADAFQRPVVSRLLHMDIWSENILIDEQGNVTGLVDLDRALWGDVEIEFAVLDYCGISEPPFWEGYGTPRDMSEPARIRQVFYLLYELQKYMPIIVWRRNDRVHAAQYKAQSLALAEQIK